MISLGPFAFSSTLAVAILSIIWWFVLAVYYDKRHQLGLERCLSFILIAALLLGRVVFVVQYWAQYSRDLWSILNIRDGGFNLPIALAVLLGALAYVAYQSSSRRRYVARLVALGGGVSVAMGYGAALYFAAPAFLPTEHVQLQDLNGQSVSLEHYQGQPVVLNVWASWCPPCRAEMPILEQAQQHNPDVHFVFVNQGESRALIQQFLAEQGLHLQHVLSDIDATVLTSLQGRALPTTLFMNEQGQLVDMRVGELSSASLAAYLKRLQR